VLYGLSGRLATLAMFALFVAPLAPAQAAVGARPAAPTVTTTNDGDCGTAALESLDAKMVPAVALQLCDRCVLDGAERRALLLGFADAAHRAGLVINPVRELPLTITDTGRLPDGRPFLRGAIEGTQFTVADPLPGETLASAAGKLVFNVLSGRPVRPAVSLR